MWPSSCSAPGAGRTGPSARRFRAEAQVTAGLQHPGIPPVYQIGAMPDGRPFLAMKLIKGDTLAALLKGNPDRGRLVAAFEGVCQAVAYAHAHGVIHRDLKPSNVMVGAFGEVQVMDWGLAKLLAAADPPDDDPEETTDLRTALRADRHPDDATRAGEVLGTPAYMAPEQAAGVGAGVDRRSDVFGLGAVLCAVLTGRPPFIGEDAESTRQQAALGRLDGAFARLDGCGADPDVVALCKRCLAADKADRPADAGEVAAAVAALRQAADDRARQAALAAAAGRVRRRLGAVLAMVLLAAGVAAGVLWRRAEAALADADLAQADTVRALRTLTDQAVEDNAARRDELAPADRAFFQNVRAMWEGVAATRGSRADALALRAEGNARAAAVCHRLGDAAAAETALRAAITAYAGLVGVAPDQPDHRLELARAHTALGQVLFTAGRLPEAEDAFRAALGHGERLDVVRPGHRPDRRARGEAGQWLGEVLDAAGRTADAEAAYRAALHLRDRLAADDPAHPGHRRERFETAVYLTRLLRKAGRVADGEAAFAAALAAGRPAGPVTGTPAERHDQAVALSGLAEALRDTGRPAEALAAYREALAAHTALAAEFPGRSFHRRDLGHMTNGLANLLATAGRTAEAEAAFRSALDIRKRLAAEHPDGPDRRRELGHTHTNLANLLRDDGRPAEAEAAYRTALAAREQLVAEFPDRPGLVTDLAGILVNLGDLLRATGRAADAVGVYDRALAVVGPAHAAEPGRTDPRLFLRDAHWGRALALDRVGRAADALSDWEQALALCPDDARPTCRAGRAVSLLKAGQTDRANAEVAELEAGLPPSGYCWYTLARFAAVAGEPEACVARLRNAAAAGWWKPTVVAAEPDFAGVRDRLDFRWLLARKQAGR